MPILSIVLILYLVFGGEPDDEDAIDNDDDDDENGEDKNYGTSDGNQFINHRHIAMILWPGYFDTEVSFAQHRSYNNQHHQWSSFLTSKRAFETFAWVGM